jgi:hypothetical protein
MSMHSMCMLMLLADRQCTRQCMESAHRTLQEEFVPHSCCGHGCAPDLSHGLWCGGCETCRCPEKRQLRESTVPSVMSWQVLLGARTTPCHPRHALNEPAFDQAKSCVHACSLIHQRSWTWMIPHALVPLSKAAPAGNKAKDCRQILASLRGGGIPAARVIFLLCYR